MLLDQADATDAAARSEPANPRSRVVVKRLLRDRLPRETFQSSEAVSRALAMAGSKKAWPAIAEKLGRNDEIVELKNELDEIVKRRHQIVHEGDYVRKERPRQPRREKMTRTQAESQINFIAELIDAIHDTVS